MTTVEELIKFLTQYGPENYVEAYEGEDIGLSIISAHTSEYLDFIPCRPDYYEELLKSRREKK